MKKADIIALAEQMIAASFPSLRNKAIKVKMVKTDEYVMAVRLGKSIRLWVSKTDARRMKRSAITGVLAHELCHAEEDLLQHDGPSDPFAVAASDSSPWMETALETASERRIDAAVIKKGYGRQLLAFQKYHDRYYEPYDTMDGMTAREIEAALGRGRR